MQKDVHQSLMIASQFLQSMLDYGAYVWFAKLISVGELLIGIALIAGYLGLDYLLLPRLAELWTLAKAQE